VRSEVSFARRVAAPVCDARAVAAGAEVDDDLEPLSLLLDPLLLPHAAAVRARATSGAAVRMSALRCMGLLLGGRVVGESVIER
jgi:hypothetical protein